MQGNITNDIEAASVATFADLSDGGYAVGINFLDGKPDWVKLTYPLEWQHRYVDLDLLYEDATLKYASNNVGHITWADLKEMFPGNRAMEESAKFGLVDGNTIAITHNGLRSVASAVGKPWDEYEVKRATAALLAIHELYAILPVVPLPQTIIDVISLMAAGNRDSVIAQTLGIKIETVRQRRNSGQRMTNTETGPELVAHAIRAGWC